MPNLVFLAHRPSLQILSKTQMGVFPISGQSFIKRNRRNSRTSDDIDMKHGPVTKLDKRNKTSKKFDDDVMPGNCDAIAIFPIYGQFEAIRKLDYPSPPTTTTTTTTTTTSKRIPKKPTQIRVK